MKPKCFFCSKKVSTYLANVCSYCNKNTCMAHRLPESHKCANIDKLNQDKHEQNKEQLLSNKVTTQKVIKI